MKKNKNILKTEKKQVQVIKDLFGKGLKTKLPENNEKRKGFQKIQNEVK